MNELLKKLPTTIDGIFDSIMANEKFGEPLDSIISKKFSDISEIFDFLEEPDALTDYLYCKPDEDGKITFPFAVKKVKEGVIEYRGKIGDQLSTYHTETIKEHTALMLSNLFFTLAQDKHDADVNYMLFCFLGTIIVLHDCAKKYTLGTNNKGEVCFYGHEQIGAYLAGAWIRNSFDDVSDDTIKTIIAIVFCHGKPKTEWAEKPENRESFFLFAERFIQDERLSKSILVKSMKIIPELDVGVKKNETFLLSDVRFGVALTAILTILDF